MISFDTKGILFRTRWVWFALPTDVSGVDEVAFLSYQKEDSNGFRRKEGITQLIDLTQTEEELWQGLREKFVRKQIARGNVAGVTVREGTLKEFLPLYKSLKSAKRFAGGSVRSAATVGTVLVAEHDGVCVAGGLFIGDGTSVRAYALASARLQAHGGRMREIIGYGNRMVLWEALQMYRADGYLVFDMGGILPHSLDPKERSLVEFKKAFGGTEQPYYFYRKLYSRPLVLLRKTRAFFHL